MEQSLADAGDKERNEAFQPRYRPPPRNAGHLRKSRLTARRRSRLGIPQRRDCRLGSGQGGRVRMVGSLRAQARMTAKQAKAAMETSNVSISSRISSVRSASNAGQKCMIYKSQAAHSGSEPVGTKFSPANVYCAGRPAVGFRFVDKFSISRSLHVALYFAFYANISFVNGSLGRESGCQRAGSHRPEALIISVLAEEQR